MTPDNSSFFDPNLDLHWKGKHVFDKEIKFSPNQRFHINQLSFTNTSNTSLLVNAQGKPSLLEPSVPSTYLHFDGNTLIWTPLVLSTETLGVLELKNGGTGWHSIPSEGLVFFKSNKLKTITPVEKSYLTYENDDYLWKSFNEDVDQRIKTSKTTKLFESYTSKLRLTNDGLEFDLLIDDELKPHSITFQDLNNSIYQKTDKTVLSENIQGVLSFHQGGLSFNTINRGDLILGIDDNVVGKLSSKNLENHILTVKNGVPSWVEIDIKQELRTQLNKFNFIQEEGNFLVFKGEKNYQLSTIDSDINGNAKSINSILNIDKGGTGLDLSSIALGSVLLKSNDASKLFVLNPGETGQALVSNGSSSLPSYKYLVSEIKPKNDHLITTKNKDEVQIELNTESDVNWTGDHKFKKINVQQDLEVKSILINEIENSSQTTNQLFKRNGELYYNKNGIEICLSYQEQHEKEKYVLKICDNSSLKENCTNPHNLLVPFTSSKAQNGDLWKLKRVDIYCHTPPKEDIELNLVCNNDSILHHNIVVNAFVNKASTITFSKDRFTSGDMIFIRTAELHEADNFTVWAVIEKI